MLDKFKKLALDAHLNGDRVQEEYYLQFADHYFRVLADQKQRQDDARQRREDRPQDNTDSSRSDDSRDRDYRDRDDDDDDDATSASSDSGSDNSSGKGDDRGRDQNRGSDDDRGRDDNRGRDTSSSRDNSSSRDEGDQAYEPAENPFVRDSAPARSAPKPRKPRRPARDAAAPDDDGGKGKTSAGVDPSVLPPPIGGDKTDDTADAEVKPRRRTRKPKSSGDSDEKLEAVS